MTEKSTDEINRSLARKNGYFQYNRSWWRSYGPDNRESERIEDYQLPDYCGDWKYAGPLLEELVGAYGVSLKIWKVVSGANRYRLSTPLGMFSDDIFETAIARAREAMIEVDK